MAKKVSIIFGFFTIIGLIIFLVGGLYKYDGLNYGALNNGLGAVDFGRWVKQVEALGPNINLNDPILDQFKEFGIDLKPLLSHLKEIQQPLVIHYNLFLAGAIIFPISTLISGVAYYVSKKSSSERNEDSYTGTTSAKNEADASKLKHQIDQINKKIAN